MCGIFGSCEVTLQFPKILTEQIETICISPLACLCSGFPLGIAALLAAVVAVKVGMNHKLCYIKFSISFIINSLHMK